MMMMLLLLSFFVRSFVCSFVSWFVCLSVCLFACVLFSPLYSSYCFCHLTFFLSEIKTFEFGKLIPPPDGPGEGPDKYGVCCDRAKGCDCDGRPYPPGL